LIIDAAHALSLCCSRHTAHTPFDFRAHADAASLLRYCLLIFAAALIAVASRRR